MQLGVCVGMIAWNFVVVQDNFVGQVLTFSLLYGSLYSTYIWPGKTCRRVHYTHLRKYYPNNTSTFFTVVCNVNDLVSVFQGLIALSLFLLRRDEELKVQPSLLILIGWG